MPTVDSGGVEISYEVVAPEKPGVPVCLIAGLAGTRGSFVRQTPALSKDRPVVLHDHRGTGESARPSGVYSVANMAADVIAIMDASGIEKAHMVGTSTGGAISQVLCLDYPERVQSAVLCCTWPRSDAYFLRLFEVRKQVLAELGTEAATKLATLLLHDPKFFADHHQDIAEREKAMIADAPPPEIAQQRMDAIMAHDLSRRLGDIAAPVRVTCAKNDPITPPYNSRELAKLIPGAELKLYEDGGHFFFMIHADAFNADIADFMARNE